MNTVTYDRESRLRSLLKAFSWRILATLTTVIIAWIITKKVDAAILIGSVEFVGAQVDDLVTRSLNPRY